MLADLPRELLFSIFGRLDDSSLLSVALTCRRLSTVARDSLLWLPRCRQRHYVPIGYPSYNLSPADDYWEEFCYQSHVDWTVKKLLADIVSDPASRASAVVAVPRIGLRARLQLLRTLHRSSFSLREKYYARELIYAINQRHAVLETLYMFSCDRFDPFKFLLAFDAFYLVRPCTAGPSSEESYHSFIDIVQTALKPLKTTISSLSQKIIDLGNQISAAERETFREQYLVATQKFGHTLHHFGLLNDISVRDMNPGNVAGLFLYGVFENRQQPSISLVAAIIYYFFAKWMGLPASIVVLDFDVYIRIEDICSSRAPGNDLVEEHCFFVDVNRAGKIRTVEEMQAIIQLGRGRHTSLKPSSPRAIVDVFMRHLTDRYPLHQDASRTSALMFSGVMILSFVSMFAEQNKEKVPLIAPRESNTLRILDQVTRHIDLSSIPNIFLKQGGTTNNGEFEYSEEMAQLYTMAITSLTNQIPCDLNLVYDFLFLISDDLVSTLEKKATLKKVCILLKNAGLESTDISGISSKPKPKYHLGQVVYNERSWKFGVVIGWSYVSRMRPRRAVSDNSSLRNRHDVSSTTAHNCANIRTKPDVHSSWQVQYSVFQSSYATTRILESSISPLNFSSIPNPSSSLALTPTSSASSFSESLLPPSPQDTDFPSLCTYDADPQPENFSKLISVEPTFFGLAVGKYFAGFDETHQLFIPGQELLDIYTDEASFFSARTGCQKDGSSGDQVETEVDTEDDMLQTENAVSQIVTVL